MEMGRTNAEVSIHDSKVRELRRTNKERGDKPNLKHDPQMSTGKQSNMNGSTGGISGDLRVSNQPWFRLLVPNLHDSPANVETTKRSLSLI